MMMTIPPQLLGPENLLVTLAFAFAVTIVGDKLLGRWPRYSRWIEKTIGAGAPRKAGPSARNGDSSARAESSSPARKVSRKAESGIRREG